MDQLTLTTCLAENTVPICTAVAKYLSTHLGIPVSFIQNISWQAREQQLAAGEIDLGWICGLLYVRMVDDTAVPLIPLAAPILAGADYADQPVYFSKIIVHQQSLHSSFSDLQGVTFALNEPGSYSGWVLVQAHLANLGERNGYFAEVVESGSHWQSVQWVANGRATAAAIDSTAFDYFLAQHPELGQAVRVIEVLGPSPMPPFVIQKNMPLEMINTIRELLLHMHEDSHGRALLVVNRVSRFTAVADADYNVIRQMDQLAKQIDLR